MRNHFFQLDWSSRFTGQIEVLFNEVDHLLRVDVPVEHNVRSVMVEVHGPQVAELLESIGGVLSTLILHRKPCITCFNASSLYEFVQ